MDPAAYHGLAGDVVSTILPHTEADPVALLLQFLVSFGNAVGRARHYLVEQTAHHGNLFAVLVGDTSKARRGTSADRVQPILAAADPTWSTDCVKAGMSSGEGVIFHVRDESYAMRRGVPELVDLGIADKRLLLQEHEFFRVLAVMKREGNTLSGVIRDAWDGRERLQTLTKQSPVKATNACISIMAHITVEELRGMLDETAMANGFANRFLYACVKRSKLLPFGGALSLETIKRLGDATQATINAAQQRTDAISMSEPAQARWCEEYLSSVRQSRACGHCRQGARPTDPCRQGAAGVAQNRWPSERNVVCNLRAALVAQFPPVPATSASCRSMATGPDVHVMLWARDHHTGRDIIVEMARTNSRLQ
jgi:hypothetical protein